MSLLLLFAGAGAAVAVAVTGTVNYSALNPRETPYGRREPAVTVHETTYQRRDFNAKFKPREPGLRRRG